MVKRRSNYVPTTLSTLLAGLVILLVIHNCVPFEPEGFLHVTTDSLTINTDGSVAFHGTIEDIGTEDISQHGFCWSESSLPAIDGPNNKIGSRSTTGSFSSTIPGLTRGVAYQFRAYATNSNSTIYGETKSFRIPVGSKPVADFSSNKTAIVEGESITFTDLSSNDPDTWLWNFGDGDTSNLPNPTHKYSTASNYTVSLKVSNEFGSDTEVKTNYITVAVEGTAPVAAFTASKTRVSVGESVTFTDQSINNPTSWLWNFGDGKTSTLPDPSHSYETADTYTVSLYVANSHGNDTETKPGYIIVEDPGSPPVADFEADKTIVTTGESVSFTDLSINTPTSWSWNFGDGNTSTDPNPSHSYETADTYTVSLYVANSFGNHTETKSGYIKVEDPGSAPVAAFAANKTEVLVGESVTFTDLSSNEPTSWIWVFGDGDTSNLPNPSHAYASPNTYDVKLIAANAHGSDSHTEYDYITVTSETTGTVTDIDNITYKTVKIGNQWWMAENLRTTHLNTGGTIPLQTSVSGWSTTGLSAYCWYDNNESMYGDTYGALYNFYAVETGKICPAGWHVPSDEEWKQMEMYLGMSQAQADEYEWRGTDQGTKLKATSGWGAGNNGTDTYGFKGLPGGVRGGDGDFGLIGVGGFFWTSTEYQSVKGIYRTLGNVQSDVERYRLAKNSGFSIRCVQD